ncbi:MAG: phage integrase N-terminal SAM-like domain-containing protein, partial [Planctomycetota bacterium]
MTHQPILLLKEPDHELVRLHNEFCEFSLLEKGYSPQTISDYRYSLKVLLKYFSLQQVEEINEGILRQFFYRGRKEKNWSSSAIIHHRKNLSPFFRWCVKKELLAENPFKNIEKPRMEFKLPEFYSDAEIEKIMYHIHEHPYPSEYLRKRNYALVALFLMTGLRRNELIGLKLMDVNLEENNLVVKAVNSKSKRDRIIPLSQR